LLCRFSWANRLCKSVNRLPVLFDLYQSNFDAKIGYLLPPQSLEFHFSQLNCLKLGVYEYEKKIELSFDFQ